MSITVVNDWRFKPEGDIAKGMSAASEYVEYLENERCELAVPQRSHTRRERPSPVQHRKSLCEACAFAAVERGTGFPQARDGARPRSASSPDHGPWAPQALSRRPLKS